MMMSLGLALIPEVTRNHSLVLPQFHPQALDHIVFGRSNCSTFAFSKRSDREMAQNDHPRGRGRFRKSRRHDHALEIPHEFYEMRRHIDDLIRKLNEREMEIFNLKNEMKEKVNQSTEQSEQFLQIQKELKSKISQLEEDRKNEWQNTGDNAMKEELQRMSELLQAERKKKTKAEEDTQKRVEELTREVSDTKRKLHETGYAMSDYMRENGTLFGMLQETSRQLAEKESEKFQKEVDWRVKYKALEDKLEQETEARVKVQDEKGVLMADQKALQAEMRTLQAELDSLRAEKVPPNEAEETLQEKIPAKGKTKRGVWRLFGKNKGQKEETAGEAGEETKPEPDEDNKSHCEDNQPKVLDNKEV